MAVGLKSPAPESDAVAPTNKISLVTINEKATQLWRGE